MKSSKGITLIALIITIIVLLILAGISINAIIGDNGILTQASNAKLKTMLSQYVEELETSIVGQSEIIGNEYVQIEVNCHGAEMKEYIPSMSDNYLNDFVILKNKLMYVGNDEELKNIANSMKIESGENGEEIVYVGDFVKQIYELNQGQPLDTEETPEEYKGKRLYDKNGTNNMNWNLVIDYTTSNKEKARYGSGWYLIEKNDDLDDGRKAQNNYVVNYSTGEMKILSNYQNWNIKSTLAVTDSLVVSLDPTNIANGNWGDIEVIGDAIYDSNTNAISLNNSLSNEDGEGGCLKMTRKADFSKGFTVEIYCKLNRAKYIKTFDDGGTYDANAFFCKWKGIGYDRFKALRCYYTFDSSWEDSSKYGGIKSKISNDNSSDLYKIVQPYNTHGIVLYDGFSQDEGFKTILNENKDYYFTFSYLDYDSSKTNEEYDDVMIENNFDKYSLYINGERQGYAYAASEWYDIARAEFENENSFVWIGMSPCGDDNGPFYLKGLVYATRLYDRGITSKEAKDNYDMTLKYRNSFVNK